MSFSVTRDGSRHILYDPSFFPEPEEIAFDSESWAGRDAIVGFAEGRGTTFFVNYQGQELALRHYHRGGLIARWSPDRYLWTGLETTRAWREMKLLQFLREKKLPVPRPVAAQVTHQGLFYTADIMTCRIAGAKTVSGLLQQESLETGYWVAMGGLVRCFHDFGVYHADLNANNILLEPGGRFYLIDFDRGRLRKKSGRWCQDNLDRLQRSLLKLKGLHDPFYFEQRDWENFLKGYARI